MRRNLTKKQKNYSQKPPIHVIPIVFPDRSVYKHSVLDAQAMFTVFLLTLK